MTQTLQPSLSGWRLPELPRVSGRVPAVDRETMLAADRIATDELDIGILQMMENAGRELASFVSMTLNGGADGRRVVVLAGTGNNAGGGLVAARRLAGWGASVQVVFAQPVLRLRPAPCSQLEAVSRAGVRLLVAAHDRSLRDIATDLAAADAVIDALIGYSLDGGPREPYTSLISLLRPGRAPVISLDLPSGVDASTGKAPGAAVAADATLALALPKRGSEHGDGRTLAGVRFLADIGMPSTIFAQLGVALGNPFAAGPIVRLN